MINLIDYCFVLSIDLDRPGPSVHLLNDIINTFQREEVLVIQKGLNDAIDFEKGSIKLSAKKTKKWNLLGRYAADYKYSKKVVKTIKENKITSKTFFVQSSPLAYFIVKHLKKHTNSKVLYNAQDVFPDNIVGSNLIKKILFFPFYLISKKLYKKADHIITISDDIKNTLIKKNIDDGKITVIHNWADSKNGVSDFDFKKKHKLENKFVILYAGNIGKFQNVELILEAAKKTLEQDIVYAIQGDGVRLKKISETIEREKIANVMLLSPDTLNNMPSTYSTVNINLVTLKKGIYKTALPSKLPFCLQTKTPLVFTVENKSSISKMLVDDQLTLTVEPNNVEKLLEAINIFYENYKNKVQYDTLIRDELISKYFSPTSNPNNYREVMINTLEGKKVL